jgi:hypothetical protein
MAQFFFHWIDFKYLYKIINFFSTNYHTYIHTYSLYQSIDILLQHISQTLNITNIYYMDDRLIKIYKDKWSLFLVSKHIVRVVLDDHVLSVDVIFNHQAWLCNFIREGFLVQVNQVLGYITLLCNMIRTTTAVALNRFLSFLRTLVIRFVFLVLVSFIFLGFTKILG